MPSVIATPRVVMGLEGQLSAMILRWRPRKVLLSPTSVLRAAAIAVIHRLAINRCPFGVYFRISSVNLKTITGSSGAITLPSHRSVTKAYSTFPDGARTSAHRTRACIVHVWNLLADKWGNRFQSIIFSQTLHLLLNSIYEGDCMIFFTYWFIDDLIRNKVDLKRAAERHFTWQKGKVSRFCPVAPRIDGTLRNYDWYCITK